MNIQHNVNWKVDKLNQYLTNKELKEMTILDERVNLNSSYNELNEPEMESLANALIESLKAE